MVGEEGQGVKAILNMVHHTRLDCCLGSSGGMRRGLAVAMHHAEGRSAFGQVLSKQPLMMNVLADIGVEVTYILIINIFCVALFSKVLPLRWRLRPP